MITAESHFPPPIFGNDCHDRVDCSGLTIVGYPAKSFYVFRAKSVSAKRMRVPISEIGTFVFRLSINPRDFVILPIRIRDEFELSMMRPDPGPYDFFNNNISVIPVAKENATCFERCLTVGLAGNGADAISSYPGFRTHDCGS